MMPALLRRCPNCRYVGLRGRFGSVGGGFVECPSCGCRFEPGDDPRLA